MRTEVDATPDWRSKFRGSSWFPIVISVAAHVALVVGAFFVVWTRSAGEPERPPAVVSFLDPSLSEQPEALQQSEWSDLPAVEPVEIEMPELSLDMIDTEALLDQLTTLEPALPDDSAPARRPTTSESVQRPVKFFGQSPSNAERVIYVVDASASMIGVFPNVLDELERSVRRLSPTQQFQVIFFSVTRDRPSGYFSADHPADAESAVETTRMIRATRSHIQHVLAWTRAVVPGGQSNPIEALRTALALQPDAVFLLSREISSAGAYEATPEQILAELDVLNPVRPRSGTRAVTISVIQVLDEDESGLLRAIGSRHGSADGSLGWIFLDRSTLLGIEEGTD